MFATQNQLSVYGFSNVVNLLGSSPGTPLHLLIKYGKRAQRIVEAS